MQKRYQGRQIHWPVGVHAGTNRPGIQVNTDTPHLPGEIQFDIYLCGLTLETSKWQWVERPGAGRLIVI